MPPSVTRGRIERAIVMQGGQVLLGGAEQTIAGFERSDAAKMRGERGARPHTRPSTPLGSKQTVRIGVPAGSWTTMARSPPERVQRWSPARPSGREQALISGTAVMVLGGAARQQVGSQPLSGPVVDAGRHPGACDRTAQRSGHLGSRRSVAVEPAAPAPPAGSPVRGGVAPGAAARPRAGQRRHDHGSARPRQHARIERRPEGFACCSIRAPTAASVAIEGKPECFVRQEQMLLDGPGRLGCGFGSTTELERDLVFFDIV